MDRKYSLTDLKKTFLGLILTIFWGCAPAATPSDNHDNLIRVCFSQPCFTQAALQLIDNSKATLDIAFYSFENEQLAQAILKAHDRGIKVRLVSDYDSENHQSFLQLQKARIPIVFGNLNAIMHNKYLIADKKWIATGSVNFSQTIQINFNHSNIIRSSKIAQCYTQDFEIMFREGLFSTAKDDSPQHPSWLQQKTQIGQYEIQPLFTPYKIYYPKVLYPDPENPSKTLTYQNIITQIIPFLVQSSSSIQILAYTLTDKILIHTLKQQALKGVSVSLWLDNDFYHQAALSVKQRIQDLAAHRVKIKLCQRADGGILHHKSILIDGHTVISGSFNFSQNGAESNDENMLIIENAENLIEAYQLEIGRIDALSTPLEK